MYSYQMAGAEQQEAQPNWGQGQSLVYADSCSLTRTKLLFISSQWAPLALLWIQALACIKMLLVQYSSLLTLQLHNHHFICDDYDSYTDKNKKQEKIEILILSCTSTLLTVKFTLFLSEKFLEGFKFFLQPRVREAFVEQ